MKHVGVGCRVAGGFLLFRSQYGLAKNFIQGLPLKTPNELFGQPDISTKISRRRNKLRSLEGRIMGASF